MKELTDNDILEILGIEHADDNSGKSFNPAMIRDLALALLGKWKFILAVASISAIVGMAIGFGIPRTYVSTATMAPELTTRNTAGGLTSLANLAGINMNSLAVTDAMHPEMYPAIVKSPNFMISLFDLPVSVNTDEGPVQTDLYDYVLNYTRQPWWQPIIGFPFMLKDMIMSLFEKDADSFESAEGHQNMNAIRLTREQELVAKSLGKAITITVEKKTYIIKISAKMQDRMIAAQVANAATERLQRFVIDYRTERTRHNVEYYTKMVEDTKADYLKTQREYARYVDSHQSMSMRSYEVEAQRLQNEANLRYQMYNSMSQQLLQTEAKLQLESPVLVVIQPGLAPQIGKPSKVKIMILFFILGFIGACAWIGVKEYMK